MQRPFINRPIELKDASVLVTGAGGFIGSHLVERLIGLGAHVRAFVRYTSRVQAGFLDSLAPAQLASVEIVHGDLRDSDAVRKSMEGIRTVFHLGALIGIPYSYVHPKETVETNVSGTLNVLLAARDAGAERVVHTSTSEVYGTARYAPIDEAHPLQGQSPYSASKIGADKITESFYNSYGLPVVIVRPFNTYGPRQSARAVIPTIITQALAGGSVTLGNLNPTRDFTYVSDTVEGFIMAATSGKTIGRTVNLGTSEEISIKDLVLKIGLIMGKVLVIKQQDERRRSAASEVDRLISDNRLAQELTGWKPAVSLDEGLRLTVDWISRHLDLYPVGKYTI